MKIVSVENVTRPLNSPVRAGYCSSFLCRLRGLTFRQSIPIEEGLLLVQDRESKLDASIHMMFVFTDLAVIWINANRKVVDVCLAKKWHPAYMPAEPAQYVLEMAPERLADFSVGDQLAFG
jgi:uncharacterized membrane protein (UPF0127 family)